jgi:hypothetical protein
VTPVIAVDPGQTTGVATRYPHRPVQHTAWEGDWTSTLDWLEGELKDLHWVSTPTVVVEAFRITRVPAAKTPAPWSLEWIGAARWLCGRYDAELVLQSSSDAKGFATNRMLRQVGLWVPAKGHANDATRHLLLRLARTGQFDGIRLD